MAGPTEEPDAILRRTVREAAERVPLTAAYLFGSYADGNPHGYSDIDVALFSPAVDHLGLGERLHILCDVRFAVGAEIELHLFSDRCLQESRPSNLYGHIPATGRRIA